MLNAEFTLSIPTIEADFAIFAAGTTWGSIVGTLSDQEDLQQALDEKENIISSDNKLNADLIDDTDTVNKFVTSEDVETWNAKQNAITSSNKLSSDLVTDTNATNKFVTTTQINTWNAKQDAIADLATIRSNATDGKSAYNTIQTYGNIVTHNTSEFATAAQGALADTAIQPNELNTALSGKQDVISDLSTIRAGATAGATALQGQEYGTIVINI